MVHCAVQVSGSLPNGIAWVLKGEGLKLSSVTSYLFTDWLSLCTYWVCKNMSKPLGERGEMKRIECASWLGSDGPVTEQRMSYWLPLIPVRLQPKPVAPMQGWLLPGREAEIQCAAQYRSKHRLVYPRHLSLEMLLTLFYTRWSRVWSNDYWVLSKAQWRYAEDSVGCQFFKKEAITISRSIR